MSSFGAPNLLARPLDPKCWANFLAIREWLVNYVNTAVTSSGSAPPPESVHAARSFWGNPSSIPADNVDMSLATVAGLLAGLITPAPHHTTHEAGGSDQIDLTNVTAWALVIALQVEVLDLQRQVRLLIKSSVSEFDVVPAGLEDDVDEATDTE